MPSLLPLTLPNLPPLSFTSIIDVLIVAFLIYQFFMIMRGRRAFTVLLGMLILGVTYLVASAFHLELLRSILAAAAPYTGLALIVLFQSELRRLFARIGRSQLLGLGGRMQRREMNQEIVLAVSQLAQNKIGALIVIERDVGLRTFIESGVALDAFVSRDLLCSIFEPGGALHDGAVIIQRDRIAAAACFLPLTMNPHLASQLGTRHRAGIGITEEADCLSIIVSEETGRISLVAFGEIELDITTKRVEQRLASHARRRDPTSAQRDEIYSSEAGSRDSAPPEIARGSPR